MKNIEPQNCLVQQRLLALLQNIAKYSVEELITRFVPISSFFYNLKKDQKFLDYLKEIEVLNRGDYERAMRSLDDSDTNINGYDIHIDGNFPILAEIKSTFPCDNNGKTYGPAQQTEILEDIRRLALEEEKKKELKNESLNNYYRFQVLLESPDTGNTRVAIEKLMNTKKASGLSNHCYYLEQKGDLKKDRIGILCISL